MGKGCGVKLLLDENISRRIVPALQAEFPGTTQAALVGESPTCGMSAD
jgi:hypothetical protein